MIRKLMIASVLMVIVSTPAAAGTMRGWVEFVYQAINTPLIDTLEIYRTDGFVLIDVAANYAAYSYSAKRLTVEQRKATASVENDAGLVVRYESCAPQAGWLGGEINHASVAMKISDATDLAEEIRELLEFAESNNFIPWGVGASSTREDQSYIGWNDANGISIEMQINKNTHQIKFQFIKECENKQ